MKEKYPNLNLMTEEIFNLSLVTEEAFKFLEASWWQGIVGILTVLVVIVAIIGLKRKRELAVDKNVKQKKVECPHCRGRTTCDCMTCGEKEPHYGYWRSGICKVCQGLGYVIEEEEEKHPGVRGRPGV